MEFIIPALALGGLYKVSQTQKKENFENAKQRKEMLPNMNIPDSNFPNENNGDKTTKLSTMNVSDSPSVYTDKFFNVNLLNSQKNLDKKPNVMLNQSNNNYRSMTGEVVSSDYFSHNNMVPFFGSKSHTNNASNATESTLDNYVGSASQHISKSERAPLFSPDTNYQWANGMPSTVDFIQSRINPGMSMNGIKPFEPINVGPGLGLGYTSEGAGGFNSGLMARDQWRDKTVDELRVVNKQKASGTGLLGYEGPAMSFVPKTTDKSNMGIMEKHRVEKTFEMGQDRLFTTTGIEKGTTARAIPVPKFVSRPETSVEYTGVAGNGHTAHVIRGEYMPSHNQQLDSPQLLPAYALNYGGPNENDYGVKSTHAYPNNRSISRTEHASQDGGYFGAVKSSIGAAVAPFVDMLKPSRKENTVGNLRPYQNVKAPVESSYYFNPNDQTAVTIRQTTENSKWHLQQNANQHGGAYQSTPHQAIANERDTTTDYFYTGGSSAREGGQQARTYDGEYRQRNNEIKSSTINGRMVPGGMALLNNQVHMTQRPQEKMLVNERPVDGKFYAPTPSMDTMGALQGHNNLNLYQGQQLDRNSGDILAQLKGNPYTLSVLNGL